MKDGDFVGTRGTYGFRHNGREYLFYNHFDSYFTGLGINVINVIKSIDVETMRRAVDNHVRVKSDDKATDEEYKELLAAGIPMLDDREAQMYADDPESWYVLLREIQYEVKYFASGLVRFWPLSNDFINDTLFCEWGYIIDLDAERLEIYRNGRHLAGMMTFYFIKEHDFNDDGELWESYYEAWPKFNEETLESFVDYCKSRRYLDKRNYDLSNLVYQKDSVKDVYQAIEILKAS